MPQLIMLALLGTGAYVGIRWIRKQARNMANDMAARQNSARGGGAGSGQKSGPVGTGEKARELGELEWDEAEGVYRPRRDGSV